MITRFFLDGVEIGPPLNYKELEIELNYDKDANQSKSSSINEWEFGVNTPISPDGAYTLFKYLADGLTTGNGVFEGLPFKVVCDNQKGTSLTLSDSYVDVGTAKFEHDKITAKTVEQGSVDWLNTTADSFTFEYLDSIGKIDKSLYIPVPYCINKKQNSYELIIAALTIFVIVDKIQEQITNIGEKVTSAANPFMATNTFSIIVRIIYIIALFVALIGLIIKLYNLLVQPVKYHYGMYVKDLMRIGLDHLGLKFSSSILEKAPFNQLLILPEKYTLPENTGVLASIAGLIKPKTDEQKGYYKGTLGDLIRSMKTMFYAKLIIQNGTCYFEKYNFKLSNSTYKIPDLYDARHRFELNVEEIKSTILISFSTDQADRNTIQEYLGTSVQITTVPKAITNKLMVTLKGLDEARIPFALAKRKDSLNVIEEIIGVFLKGISVVINVIVTVLNLIIKLLNVIIKVINALIKALKFIGLNLKFQIPTIPSVEIVNFDNIIEDRIGMMKMESDFVQVPKLMLIGNSGNSRNNKLLDGNAQYLKALYLWDNFHYFKSPIPYKDSLGNQSYLYDIDGPPFTFDDFLQVNSSNAVENYAGEEGELISLKWNPEKETATGRYRIFRQYTNNLTQSINEPDGR